ncbi:MAG: TlpA family protein disulfide reductase [Acidobacteria bacterium]|nr:TlpA family protein disulfide reductase [Acidobacteriota bacterium]MBS1867939.1 TlpA family protein disulfide reductase [Acidobacteriota bacterium]
MTHIVAGNVAPNFSLKSFDGNEFSLSAALKKGPVLLAFFKVSCPICQFTFPFLERLYQRSKSPNLTIVGVSQNGPEKTAKFNQEYGVTFPVLVDPEEKDYLVSNAYGLTMVPTLILVDADGSVLVSSMGFVKADIESIASQLANRAQLAKAPLFLPADSVPSVRPG